MIRTYQTEINLMYITKNFLTVQYFFKKCYMLNFSGICIMSMKLKWKGYSMKNLNCRINIFSFRWICPWRKRQLKPLYFLFLFQFIFKYFLKFFNLRCNYKCAVTLVGIAGIIILVIVFGFVKFCCGQNFGDNWVYPRT